MTRKRKVPKKKTSIVLPSANAELMNLLSEYFGVSWDELIEAKIVELYIKNPRMQERLRARLEANREFAQMLQELVQKAYRAGEMRALFVQRLSELFPNIAEAYINSTIQTKKQTQPN